MQKNTKEEECLRQRNSHPPRKTVRGLARISKQRQLQLNENRQETYSIQPVRRPSTANGFSSFDNKRNHTMDHYSRTSVDEVYEADTQVDSTDIRHGGMNSGMCVNISDNSSSDETVASNEEMLTTETQTDAPNTDIYNADTQVLDLHLQFSISDNDDEKNYEHSTCKSHTPRKTVRGLARMSKQRQLQLNNYRKETIPIQPAGRLSTTNGFSNFDKRNNNINHYSKTGITEVYETETQVDSFHSRKRGMNSGMCVNISDDSSSDETVASNEEMLTTETQTDAPNTDIYNADTQVPDLHLKFSSSDEDDDDNDELPPKKSKLENNRRENKDLEAIHYNVSGTKKEFKRSDSEESQSLFATIENAKFSDLYAFKSQTQGMEEAKSLNYNNWKKKVGVNHSRPLISDSSQDSEMDVPIEDLIKTKQSKSLPEPDDDSDDDIFLSQRSQPESCNTAEDKNNKQNGRDVDLGLNYSQEDDDIMLLSDTDSDFSTCTASTNNDFILVASSDEEDSQNLGADDSTDVRETISNHVLFGEDQFDFDLKGKNQKTQIKPIGPGLSTKGSLCMQNSSSASARERKEDAGSNIYNEDTLYDKYDSDDSDLYVYGGLTQVPQYDQIKNEDAYEMETQVDELNIDSDSSEDEGRNVDNFIDSIKKSTKICTASSEINMTATGGTNHTSEQCSRSKASDASETDTENKTDSFERKKETNFSNIRYEVYNPEEDEEFYQLMKEKYSAELEGFIEEKNAYDICTQVDDRPEFNKNVFEANTQEQTSGNLADHDKDFPRDRKKKTNKRKHSISTEDEAPGIKKINRTSSFDLGVQNDIGREVCNQVNREQRAMEESFENFRNRDIVKKIPKDVYEMDTQVVNEKDACILVDNQETSHSDDENGISALLKESKGDSQTIYEMDTQIDGPDAEIYLDNASDEKDEMSTLVKENKGDSQTIYDMDTQIDGADAEIYLDNASDEENASDKEDYIKSREENKSVSAEQNQVPKNKADVKEDVRLIHSPTKVNGDSGQDSVTHIDMETDPYFQDTQIDQPFAAHHDNLSENNFEDCVDGNKDVYDILTQNDSNQVNKKMAEKKGGEHIPDENRFCFEKNDIFSDDSLDSLTDQPTVKSNKKKRHIDKNAKFDWQNKRSKERKESLTSKSYPEGHYRGSSLHLSNSSMKRVGPKLIGALTMKSRRGRPRNDQKYGLPSYRKKAEPFSMPKKMKGSDDIGHGIKEARLAMERRISGEQPVLSKKDSNAQDINLECGDVPMPDKEQIRKIGIPLLQTAKPKPQKEINEPLHNDACPLSLASGLIKENKSINEQNQKQAKTIGLDATSKLKNMSKSFKTSKVSVTKLKENSSKNQNNQFDLGHALFEKDASSNLIPNKTQSSSGKGNLSKGNKVFGSVMDNQTQLDINSMMNNISKLHDRERYPSGDRANIKSSSLVGKTTEKVTTNMKVTEAKQGAGYDSATSNSRTDQQISGPRKSIIQKERKPNSKKQSVTFNSQPQVQHIPGRCHEESSGGTSGTTRNNNPSQPNSFFGDFGKGFRNPLANKTNLMEKPTKNYPNKEIEHKDPREIEKMVSDGLQTFLQEILEWNPNWLSEAVKFKEKQPHKDLQLPPGVEKITLFKLCESYHNFQEYVKIFKAHIMFETWEMAFKGWQIKTERKPSFTFSHGGLQNVPGSKFIFHHAYMVNKRNSNQKAEFRKNDLVIVSIENANGYRAFGYIDDAAPKRDRDHQKVLSSLRSLAEQSEKYKNEKIDILNIKFRTKNTKILQNIEIDTKVKVQNVVSLETVVRQITAMFYLHNNILCNHILRPLHSGVFQEKQVLTTKMKQQLPQFNESQQVAIETVGKVCTQPVHLPRITLLHGPPGTGKSHTIIGMVARIMKDTQGSGCICLCAPSNAAVDELARRLTQLKRHDKDLKCLKLVRIGDIEAVHRDIKKYHFRELCDGTIRTELDRKVQNMLPESLTKECASLKEKHNVILRDMRKCNDLFKIERLNVDLKKIKQDLHNLENQCSQIRNTTQLTAEQEYEISCNILKRANVICGTLNSFGAANIVKRLGFSNRSERATFQFTCMLLDEASQATELDCLIPLQYGISKLIMVGDPEQLPPTVLSKRTQEKNFGQSLFERLFNYFKYHQNEKENPVLMLNTQYRMNSEIAHFPCSYIYNGALKTDGTLIKRDEKFPLKPYVFFNLVDGREQINSVRSVSNELEAEFSVGLCRYLFSKHKLKGPDIGIITMYQNQKSLIKSLLVQYQISDVEVGTIDGFQGREKLIILVSCVRASEKSEGIGFVDNRKRLNVALTRAKSSLIVVGHTRTLQKSSDWNVLIKDAKNREMVIDVFGNDFIHSFSDCIKKTFCINKV